MEAKLSFLQTSGTCFSKNSIRCIFWKEKAGKMNKRRNICEKHLAANNFVTREDTKNIVIEMKTNAAAILSVDDGSKVAQR